jgi:fucose permease
MYLCAKIKATGAFEARPAHTIGVMPISPSPRLNRGRLIPAAILAILVYGLIAPIVGTLLPTLSHRFAMPPDQNGTLLSIKAVGLVIASLAIGPLIDLKGKKASLVGGLVVITLSLFLLPSAASFSVLAFVVLVLNLGGGMIVTGSNALASDVGEDRRGSTLNLLNLFFGLGAFLTPLIAAYVFGANPILLCYLLGAFCVLTLLFEIVTPMPAATGEVSFKLRDAARLLTKPALLLLSLLLFLYVACEVGVWDWLVRHLEAQGIKQETALNVLSFGFALGLLFGRVIVSRVLVKVPAVTVTLFSAIAMAITTWAMLQVSSVVAAATLVFCAGLAMAPVFPTTLAMVGDAFPAGTATAMGIAITSGWLGLAFSSKIIGAIAGQDATNLKTALLVLPAASILMVLVNLALRPMLKRHAA